MNFIFLDVDGVLNNEKFLIDRDHRNRWDQISDENIDNLKKICEAFDDIKIILSSSWRHGFFKDKDGEIKSKSKDLMNKYLIDKLSKRGLKLSGLTKSFCYLYEDLDINSKWTRDFEILDYINTYLSSEDKFVIFDDENIDLHGLFKNHFVRTEFKSGLTEDDVEKAIKILK